MFNPSNDFLHARYDNSESCFPTVDEFDDDSPAALMVAFEDSRLLSPRHCREAD